MTSRFLRSCEPISDVGRGLPRTSLADISATSHRVALWVVIIAAATVVHLWLFFRLPNAGPVQFWCTIAIHAIAVIGPFWMLAHWFVKRRKQLRWQRCMWLVFVP